MGCGNWQEATALIQSLVKLQPRFLRSQWRTCSSAEHSWYNILIKNILFTTLNIWIKVKAFFVIEDSDNQIPCHWLYDGTFPNKLYEGRKWLQTKMTTGKEKSYKSAACHFEDFFLSILIKCQWQILVGCKGGQASS